LINEKKGTQMNPGEKKSGEAHLVDIKGAAEYLATSVRHLRGLVTKREIPFHKIGKLIRFDTRDLDAFIEAGRVEARQGPLAVPFSRRKDGNY
jgi:excisionase family DNA binding protein